LPTITTSLRGVAFSLAAALLWGVVPVYIGYVDAINPLEIIVHRALWSGVILCALVLFLPRLTGGIAAARAALASAGAQRGFLLSCAMLTVNWGVFVYAIMSRQVFDAALGYFIYPLVAVVFGIVLLNEKLDRWGMGGDRHRCLWCAVQGADGCRRAVDCTGSVHIFCALRCGPQASWR
jgi:chloramphenicol-sensitive protein RarD